MDHTDTTIYFYRVRDEYGFLSNFKRSPFILKDRTWDSVEHYFQAQKFAGTPHEEEVRLAKSPKDAATMGRDRTRPLRPDWESVKDSIMYDALLAKYGQNEDLREKLLATGDAPLIEHTRNDAYWGDGGDGTGKNMLGVLLCMVRAAYRTPWLVDDAAGFVVQNPALLPSEFFLELFTPIGDLNDE